MLSNQAIATFELYNYSLIDDQIGIISADDLASKNYFIWSFDLHL